MAVIGLDLKEERGWKSKEDLTKGEVHVLAGIVREAARC